MTVQAAVEARAVTCRTRAGGVTVRDVSLTVGQGELVGIIGGSGSGKSTLLAALSGLRPPAAGTVLRYPDRQAGYVPAGDSIAPVLPLARALRYTGAMCGVSDSSSDAVDDALDLAGLAAAASIPVGTLNPGERKRAEIAAELLADPAALFLDEPTAFLDPAQAVQVLRLLRRLSDAGAAVLLTTKNPLDAARCAKVAVLATGGHLAFFGTPAAARGYFGADSLEEIYERLAGLGDPAVAWSRRFLYFSRTAAGSAPIPTTPRAPGPALLIPDQAGPHSAGRPSLPATRNGSGDPEEYGRELDLSERNAMVPAQGRGLAHEDGLSPDPADDVVPAEPRPTRPAARPARRPGPVRQLPILISRNAEVLARARQQQVIMGAAPLAVLLVFSVLLGLGALDGRAAVTLAWAILGGLATGVAYEFPWRATEAGVLRRERFSGLSTAAFLTAKAIVLLPVLALADVLILAIPGMADRLQLGFGLSYLAVFAASVAGLTAATILNVSRDGRRLVGPDRGSISPRIGGAG
jgi:ABC-type multidrug transport system ATPase subunit